MSVHMLRIPIGVAARQGSWSRVAESWRRLAQLRVVLQAAARLSRDRPSVMTTSRGARAIAPTSKLGVLRAHAVRSECIRAVACRPLGYALPVPAPREYTATPIRLALVPQVPVTLDYVSSDDS